MFINWSALKKHKAETPLLVVDLCVLFLISVNLLVLLVDSIVMNTGVGVLLAKHYPTDYLAYKNNWHKDLPLYDSLFTVFLLTELGLRWLFAIKKTYCL